MLKPLFAFFSHLSKRKKQEKLILYFAAFIVLLGLLYLLILQPILFKIQSLNQGIQRQETKIKKSLQILAQKDKIKKEVNYYASYVKHTQSQEEEGVIFLKEIEELANKSSVYVIDIKLTTFEEEDLLKKYFLRLNCEAQMEQLNSFFYEIENSNKLLKIEDYDIRPKTEGSDVVRCTASVSKAFLPLTIIK